MQMTLLAVFLVKFFAVSRGSLLSKRLGLAVGAMVALQISCMDISNFSPSADRNENSAAQSKNASNTTANFGLLPASAETRLIADAVLISHDNAGKNFLIIDKKQATLYVFNFDGVLQGASPVLLGAARGDENILDIGTRPIDQILAHERTTPAGRFVGERGQNTLGEDIIWVDYDAAVSIHRVRVTNASERRLERLATPSAQDNRISYGCINVPSVFYENVVVPTFKSSDAVVYVLPDLKSLNDVFSFSGSLGKNLNL